MPTEGSDGRYRPENLRDHAAEYNHKTRIGVSYGYGERMEKTRAAHRTLNCPVCKSPIDWQFGKVFPSRCSSCGVGLLPTFRSPLASYIGSLILAALVAYNAGLRNILLIGAVLIASWPICFLILWIDVRFFGVKVEVSGDFRSMLYGATDLPAGTADSRVAEPDAPEGEMTDRDESQIALNRAESWTLEGAVITFGAIALGVWIAAVTVKPVIYRVFPKWDATRTGPKVFPIGVHIGEVTIEFTNGSDHDWDCTAGLGAPESTTSFGVPARHSRAIPYRQFIRPAKVSLPQLPRFARVRISISCTETSPPGLTHYWIF